VEGRMDAGGKTASYMFDGFPRTLQQATMLEDSLARRDGRLRKVFFLDAKREVLVQRLAGRRICRQCGRNYHRVNLPPKREGICDVCGGELYQRADDQEATILNRLDVFRKQTEALIACYEKKGLLVRVDSSQSRESLIERILTLLKAS
jgi:adenylate kinase